jgi:hypothetical protein
LGWIAVQAAKEIAPPAQYLVGLGDDPVDDFGRRRNIMDQACGLTGKETATSKLPAAFAAA